MEPFNSFVTVPEGFTTDRKASFGRIIMSDLVSGSCVVLMYYVGRGRRTLGLEGLKGFVVEQEIWCLAWWADNWPPGKYVAWVFKVGLGSR